MCGGSSTFVPKWQILSTASRTETPRGSRVSLCPYISPTPHFLEKGWLTKTKKSVGHWFSLPLYPLLSLDLCFSAGAESFAPLLWILLYLTLWVTLGLLQFFFYLAILSSFSVSSSNAASALSSLPLSTKILQLLDHFPTFLPFPSSPDVVLLLLLLLLLLYQQLLCSIPSLSA